MTEAFAPTVDRFLVTLVPGEQVRAVELRRRYLAWAGGADAPTLTATALGRCAKLSRLVMRHRMGGGLGYTVLPPSTPTP